MKTKRWQDDPIYSMLVDLGEKHPLDLEKYQAIAERIERLENQAERNRAHVRESYIQKHRCTGCGGERLLMSEGQFLCKCEPNGPSETPEPPAKGE